MTKVALKEITPENFKECLALKVADSQEHLIASTVRSLAEAYVYGGMLPYAVYDASGVSGKESRMVGFAMCEIANGIGFITRVMVDESQQHRGYGKAIVMEAVRKLELNPEVETVATSHLKHNTAATQLFNKCGFKEWSPEWASQMPDRRVLKLEKTNPE